MKLFFAIYKDEEKNIQHMIVEQKSKKELSDALRDQHFIPRAIFTQKDIDKILAYEFLNINVTDKEIEYLKSHLDQWEAAKSKGV